MKSKYTSEEVREIVENHFKEEFPEMYDEALFEKKFSKSWDKNADFPEIKFPEDYNFSVKEANMETKDCKNSEVRNIVMSIRITKSMKKFMNKNKLNPSKIFFQALKSLGFKE